MVRSIVSLFFCLLFLLPGGSDAATQVWFCPLDSILRRAINRSGSPQYMDLFTPNAPWSQAASHVNIFKVYGPWVAVATSAQLKQQFADLNRRGIALALEFGLLTTSTDCASGISGESSGGEQLLTAARRIRTNGGNLQYVAMDEPIFFSNLANGKGACHWTPEQTAQNAAVNIKALLAEFPNVKIGEVEPIGAADLTVSEETSHYAAGLEAFHKALGFPLAFFHADVVWNSPAFPANLVALRKKVASEGVPFGVIYDGTGYERSDATWVKAALANMEQTEEVLKPDAVVFQSWHDYPKLLLPETDPNSFTWLIDQYFRNRTNLTTTSVTSQKVTGTLMGADGKPVAGAQVKVLAAISDGSFQTYAVDGEIPAATKAVFAIRVNTECGCSANANFMVKQLTFNGTTLDFSSPTSLAQFPDLSKASAHASVSNGELKVVARPGEKVSITSTPFPVTPNGKYHFQVVAAVPPDSVGSGALSLVFLGDKGELSRASIPLELKFAQVTTATTDANGQWGADLGAAKGKASAVKAEFNPTANRWAASSVKAMPR